MSDLVAFLPWEEDQQVTPCDESNCHVVAAKLAAAHPGKAVHVVRKGHLENEPSERPIVWDTVCPKPPTEG